MNNAIFLLKSPEYPEPMVCLTCKVLLSYKSYAGIKGYCHVTDEMNGEIADNFHLPDPVPMRESTGYTCLCDFCSTLQPEHVLGGVITQPFTETISGYTMNYSAEWSACPVCYALIEEDKWDEMTERSIALTLETFGKSVLDEYAEEFARMLHRKIRDGFQQMIPPQTK